MPGHTEMAFSKAQTGAGIGARPGSGPNGGYVLSLAIDPQTPMTVYAGTDQGVFKSADGGQNWSPASSGLNSVVVQALAIDPAQPLTVYAGTANTAGTGGIYRSLDGGGIWKPANQGLSGLPRVYCIQALATPNGGPSTIYAGTDLGIFIGTVGRTAAFIPLVSHY